MAAKYLKISQLVPSNDGSEEASPLSSKEWYEESLENLENHARPATHDRPNFWKRKAIQTLLKIAFITFISAISMMLGWSFHQLNETDCIDTAWDDVRQAVRFKTLEFNPRFHGPKSPYMGPPTPEIDRLWYDLAKLRNFAVDRQTLSKLNRTQGAVEYGATHRYQAGMEVFHQLHCLNYVRMYSYLDHYSTIDFDMLAESDEERQDHKDHCVEVLRQRLMCNADLNIYSYHWTSSSDIPLGNLYTRHRCIDWDHFYSWAESHPVLEVAPKKGDDTEVLD